MFFTEKKIDRNIIVGLENLKKTHKTMSHTYNLKNDY